jgi:peptide/nickel transport system permease protein
MRFWILASAMNKTGLHAFWRRLHSRVLSRVGLGLVVMVMLAGGLAPFLAPYDPSHQEFGDLLQGPSRQHLLGTDDLGRDVLSRLIWGARVSLQVGVIAVGIALVTGTALGLLSEYVGGMLDNWLMRLMDALPAFPVLVLALALAAVLSPSLSNVMLAIGVVGVPTYARLVRGQVLSVREWEFVQAAKAVGGSDVRILAQHVLPNITAPSIVEASLRIAAATLAEAGLSFLGLGVPPPMPSGGRCSTPGAAIWRSRPGWPWPQGARSSSPCWGSISRRWRARCA